MLYDQLISAVQTVGFPIAISVFLLIIFGWMVKQNQQQFQKQNEIVQSGMKDIAAAVGRGGLSCKQQIAVFEIIMQNHIVKKLDLIQKILIANDIHNRRCQIERNIRAEFMRITQEEITILRNLNMSVFAGFLVELDWDLFIGECAKIIFTTATNDNKLIDLKSTMNSYVTAMIKRYETNFTDSFIED